MPEIQVPICENNNNLEEDKEYKPDEYVGDSVFPDTLVFFRVIIKIWSVLGRGIQTQGIIRALVGPIGTVCLIVIIFFFVK